MAEKLDPKEIVTLEELAISSMWEMAALVEVLEKKGLLTKQDILDAIRGLRQKNPQARTPLEVDDHPDPAFPEPYLLTDTHKGTWVTGSAEYCQEDGHSLAVEADEQIADGTSGGPIINGSGELVAIVSNSFLASEARKCKGRAPCPYFALPIWVYRRILGRTC